LQISNNPKGSYKSSRTRQAEHLLLNLKRDLLYNFIEKRLLSGALLTNKKNSALLLAYFLRIALEIKDWKLLEKCSGDVLLIHLSIQDLYNEILFSSRLSFVILIAQKNPPGISLIKRVVTRLLSNVLDIRQDLQGNPSRVIKKQKNSFLPKKALSKAVRKSGDFNAIKLLGEYLIQVGTYVNTIQMEISRQINIKELIELCSEVKSLEHKRELKNIWTQVIKLWENFLIKAKPKIQQNRIKKEELDQNVQFEKIEQFVKKSFRETRNEKTDRMRKLSQKNIYSKEEEMIETNEGDQEKLATILTDMVYQRSPERQKNKSFKIRKLSNFKMKKEKTKKNKNNDLYRVNDLMKQTGNFRRGRMFLKKRSGKGGGYVKGRV
jgi:hypothetical protein